MYSVEGEIGEPRRSLASVDEIHGLLGHPIGQIFARRAFLEARQLIGPPVRLSASCILAAQIEIKSLRFRIPAISCRPKMPFSYARCLISCSF